MEVKKMIPIMDKENEKFYGYLDYKYFKETTIALMITVVFIGSKAVLDKF